MSAGNKTLLELRKSYLVQRDGYPFNPQAPESAHGRSTGYVRWSCRCEPCRDWNNSRARAANRRARLVRSRENADQLVHISVPLTLHQFDRIRDQAALEGLSIIDFVVSCAYHGRSEVPLPQAEPIEDEPDEPTELVIAEPEPVEAADSDSVEEPPRIPPMTDAVRQLIKSVADLRNVSDAYFKPDWSAETGSEGRKRQVKGAHEVIVAPDGKVIFWKQDRPVAKGASTLLTAPPKAVPKAKGGGTGTSYPTTTKALVRELEKAGATVRIDGNGHLTAVKDGKRVTFPSTPSDGRSLMNSVAQVRRAGLLERK